MSTKIQSQPASYQWTLFSSPFSASILQFDPCLLHCFHQLTPCPRSILKPQQTTMDSICIVVGVVIVEHLDLCIRQTQICQQCVSLLSNILGHVFSKASHSKEHLKVQTRTTISLSIAAIMHTCMYAYIVYLCRQIYSMCSRCWQSMHVCATAVQVSVHTSYSQ